MITAPADTAAKDNRNLKYSSLALLISLQTKLSFLFMNCMISFFTVTILEKKHPVDFGSIHVTQHVDY